MKNAIYLLIFLLVTSSVSSCSLWNKMFPAKYGCGTNGKNVGAEKIIDGSYTKKPKKFKA
jgi:hypothetical protein